MNQDVMQRLAGQQVGAEGEVAVLMMKIAEAQINLANPHRDTQEVNTHGDDEPYIPVP